MSTTHLHAPTRITTLIRMALADGKPHTVAGLAASLPAFSERTLRSHLTTLTDLGFVERTRSSRAVYRWSDDPPHLRPSRAERDWLHRWHVEIVLDADLPHCVEEWIAGLLAHYGLAT